jgi:flavin reductase (DIM6/NTAB) family NADH-FMN oxidoreductase RutF
METGFYTINHINENIYQQAHQTSARYSREISEFDATHLTPDYKLGFKAPFVKESHIQLGVQFKERINITTNNTVLVIGQINQVYFPKVVFRENRNVQNAVLVYNHLLCCVGRDVRPGSYDDK